MADDYRNTYNVAGTLGSLSSGGSATGTIETANDQDIFAISLVAGRTYTFRMQGTILAHNDDANGSLDPEIQFTAGTSGVHYLEIRGVKTGIGGYHIGVFDLA